MENKDELGCGCELAQREQTLRLRENCGSGNKGAFSARKAKLSPRPGTATLGRLAKTFQRKMASNSQELPALTQSTSAVVPHLSHAANINLNRFILRTNTVNNVEHSSDHRLVLNSCMRLHNK